MFVEIFGRKYSEPYFQAMEATEVYRAYPTRMIEIVPVNIKGSGAAPISLNIDDVTEFYINGLKRDPETLKPVAREQRADRPDRRTDRRPGGNNRPDRKPPFRKAPFNAAPAAAAAAASKPEGE